MSASKICLLTTDNSVFGMSIFHRHAKALIKTGYEVVIIGPHEEDTVVEGIKILGVPKPTNRMERLLLCPMRLFRRAFKERGEIYHMYDPGLIFYALFLRLFGKTVIYNIREDLPKQIRYKEWIPWGFRRGVSWLFKHMEQLTTKSSTAIIVAGPEIGERLLPFNRNTVLVQNFPVLEEFLDYEPDGPAEYPGKTVATLGGISRERAIVPIVQAMGLLPAELGAKLILGGNSGLAELEEEIELLPGWKLVEFVGMVPRHVARDILMNAEVALVLYSPEPNHFDIRSNRFFETMAAGIPVITSNFPKWREMVEGNGVGLTVDPSNPESIAEAIEYMLTHPEEAAEMGRQGRKTVLEKFNWAMERGKLLQLYKELLNPSKERSRQSA